MGARIPHGLLIALVAFAYLAVGVSPAHFWLDAGEIGAAGVDLGVMHPTGVPGYTHLLRAAAALPVGSLGFRLGLVSAAFGSAAIATLVAMLARRDAHPLTWWGAAVWALAGLTLARNGRVVEVYTFGAWLALVTLWGLDGRVPAARRGAARLLGVGAAAWASWCFGDLRLALGPLVLVSWIGALRRDEPWARWAPLMAVTASIAVVTVPLSSARGPTADWGDPDNLRRAWDHLNARSIREAFADQILPRHLAAWRRAAADSLARLGQDIGPLGPALAGLAALRWLFDGEDRRLAGAVVWVAAVELFYAVAINPMGGEDRQTGLLLAMCCVLAVGAVVAALPRLVPRIPATVVRGVVGPLVWTMGVLPAAWVSVPDIAATRSWMPHAWTRDALDQLPPGTLLLTQSDDLSAGVLAARVFEGARPDVVSAVGQHLHKPPPDVSPGDPRAAAPWRASAAVEGEAAKIVAAIGGWPHTVALETPRVEVFAAVPWGASAGRSPLAVAGPGAGLAPAGPADPVALWARWSPEVRSDEDRRRVARALAAAARAALVAGEQRPEALALAERHYRLILDEVAPGHVSSMVALGYVYDRLGRTAAAIEITRRALALEPGRVTALRNLALYLSRRPETLDEAQRVAAEAVRQDPADPRNRARLREICARRGDARCAGAGVEP